MRAVRATLALRRVPRAELVRVVSVAGTGIPTQEGGVAPMTGVELLGPGRWHNFVMESGSRLQTFWQAHLRAERHVMFLLGRGFDRRMCLGLRSFLEAGGAGKRDVIAIEF